MQSSKDNNEDDDDEIRGSRSWFGCWHHLYARLIAFSYVGEAKCQCQCVLNHFSPSKFIAICRNELLFVVCCMSERMLVEQRQHVSKRPRNQETKRNLNSPPPHSVQFV